MSAILPLPSRSTRPVPASGPIATPARLRALLVAVCAGAMVATLAWVEPSQLPRSDPELATLLRGMAAIKALLLVGALSAVLWRFGRPVPPMIAAGYIGGTLLMAVATALIWQLTLMLAAAVAYHLGAVVLLGIAWRVDGAESP